MNLGNGYVQIMKLVKCLGSGIIVYFTVHLSLFSVTQQINQQLKGC